MPDHKVRQHILMAVHFYCASEILICTPALVFTIGALEEM